MPVKLNLLSKNLDMRAWSSVTVINQWSFYICSIIEKFHPQKTNIANNLS